MGLAQNWLESIKGYFRADKNFVKGNRNLRDEQNQVFELISTRILSLVL